MKIVEVALGYVFDQQGRVLVAQRPMEKDFGGLWEFPGGKLEEGETPKDALTREMHEELGINVEPKQVFDHYDYRLDSGAVLRFYPVLCAWTPQPVHLTEHLDFRFVGASDLATLALAPPDHEALRLLISKSRNAD